MFRCLNAGQMPDISLRRSLLSVWCRDRKTFAKNENANEYKNGNNIVNRNGNKNENNNTNRSENENENESEMKNKSENNLLTQSIYSSAQKAEDLLAKISLILAARIFKKHGFSPQKEYIEKTSNSFISNIISWDTMEDDADLLPHPSVYMQLANAWNDEESSVKESSIKESSVKDSSLLQDRNNNKMKKVSVVSRAEKFLSRVNKDLDSLMLSIKINHANTLNKNHKELKNKNDEKKENESENKNDDKNENINITNEKDIDGNRNIDYKYSRILDNDQNYESKKEDIVDKKSNNSPVESFKNEIDLENVTKREKDELRIKSLIELMRMDTTIEKEVENEVVLPLQGKSDGLYISYNLLLAAHAIQSTGTGHCIEAEVREEIMLHCSILYCIVLSCFILYCIVLYCIVLYCIVLYCIVLYCIVLYCIVLYCIVLYCIDLYCIVLYCIVLYCVMLTYFMSSSLILQCPFLL